MKWLIRDNISQSRQINHLKHEQQCKQTRHLGTDLCILQSIHSYQIITDSISVCWSQSLCLLSVSISSVCLSCCPSVSLLCICLFVPLSLIPPISSREVKFSVLQLSLFVFHSSQLSLSLSLVPLYSFFYPCLPLFWLQFHRCVCICLWLLLRLFDPVYLFSYFCVMLITSTSTSNPNFWFKIITSNIINLST